jgi:magnesium chelatase subunit I
VFTANGRLYQSLNIVTPLKDRIGSQILTHYPETVKLPVPLPEQEAKLDAVQSDMVHVPSLAKDLWNKLVLKRREK